ncbi:MAG: hypothetical protein DMG07_02970 [Acidobacteria bacterium]|nr:MAG: hypothetical protein DMG07_02970 [Acidobacteriota bacterium]
MRFGLSRRALLVALVLFTVQPTRPCEPDAAWAGRTLSTLSLREKIGQLVQIRLPGKFLNRRSREFLEILDQIRRNQVGGLILFAGNVYESAILLNDLQRESKLPLIVAADFERGASFRIADTTSFPWTMAVGATGSEDLAYQEGVITGREARALGVTWVYAPVLDVNSNPDNPVINVRSYGEDPNLVARLGAAFIRGCREQGVLTTAKHFPGHGDTATDSHIGLPVVSADRSRLDRVELVPFRTAIAAGVDAVMTAHVAVPRVTGEGDLPATLSPRVLTELLRERLGFQGIVVTDALEMGGITSRAWAGKAAVQALAAGADALLLSPNVDAAIDAVERAVRRGEISEARIERSCVKLLEAKARLGLDRERAVSLERIAAEVASPESQRIAAEIADRSITLVRDRGRLVPIDPIRPPRIFSVALSSELDSAPAAVFQAELKRRFPGARTASIDPRAPDDLVASILKSAAEADTIVCATVVRVITGRGNVALPEVERRFLERLFGAGKPVVWITFGNPYLLRHYRQVGTYLAAFSYADVSQVAAARALAGETAITGKMPVSIPELAPIGTGLRVPKLEMTLKAAPAESMGLEANALRATERMLAGYLEEGTLSDAALAVGYRGALVLQSGTRARLEATALAGTIGLVAAAWMLVESGQLQMEAPVRDYVPEFGEPWAANLKVRGLLEQPGGRAAGLLAESVARASGRKVDALVARELLEPLGIASNASARDLAVFGQMLLNGGLYDHRRFLRAETVARLIAGPPWNRASAPSWASTVFSSSAFGVSDGEGAMLWVDPVRELVLALVTRQSARTRDSRALAEAERALALSVTTAVARRP